MTFPPLPLVSSFFFCCSVQATLGIPICWFFLGMLFGGTAGGFPKVWGKGTWRDVLIQAYFLWWPMGLLYCRSKRAGDGMGMGLGCVLGDPHFT
ncbi:hypothetical protein V8C40DRAFT_203265 [Trichoderma camerunense]